MAYTGRRVPKRLSSLKNHGAPVDTFLEDLIAEAVADIRGCLEGGAHRVQIDFTEGRLSVKLDPSKGLLRQFIDLNNRVLDHFTTEQRQRIGIHTCPGGDIDSTHSADVDYTELLPSLFNLRVGNFYLQLASERNSERALRSIKESIRPGQRAFVGVIDVLSKSVETPELVRNRVLKAAEYIPVGNSGRRMIADSRRLRMIHQGAVTSRFAKIRARVLGTQLASEFFKQ